MSNRLGDRLDRAFYVPSCVHSLSSSESHQLYISLATDVVFFMDFNGFLPGDSSFLPSIWFVLISVISSFGFVALLIMLINDNLHSRWFVPPCGHQSGALVSGVWRPWTIHFFSPSKVLLGQWAWFHPPDGAPKSGAHQSKWSSHAPRTQLIAFYSCAGGCRTCGRFRRQWWGGL